MNPEPPVKLVEYAVPTRPGFNDTWYLEEVRATPPTARKAYKLVVVTINRNADWVKVLVEDWHKGKLDAVPLGMRGHAVTHRPEFSDG